MFILFSFSNIWLLFYPARDAKNWFEFHTYHEIRFLEMAEKKPYSLKIWKNKKRPPETKTTRAVRERERVRNHTKENPPTLNKLQEKLNWWESMSYTECMCELLFLLALAE